MTTSPDPAAIGDAAVTVASVNEARWPDLVDLFGPNGAVGGCWCMWWRVTRSQWEKDRGAANRRALEGLAIGGRSPGLLAYVDGTAVGWCSVGPRSDFPVLARSPVLKPVDQLPVWSVVCFFVARKWRDRGVASALLATAVERARDAGAPALEGYPVEPRAERMPDLFAHTGIPVLFEAAGFAEVARRSKSRPLFRLEL